MSALPTITIKPLVWKVDPPLDAAPPKWTWYCAHGGHRRLFTICDSAGHFWLDNVDDGPKEFPTLAAAQAAAQEQWTLFIRAAIQP